MLAYHLVRITGTGSFKVGADIAKAFNHLGNSNKKPSHCHVF